MKRNSNLTAADIILVFLLILGAPCYADAAASPGDGKKAPDAHYRYNPARKPDPFQPFVEKELALKKKAERAAAVSSMFPLQRAGLDQYNLVGIAGDAERRMAIVETKEGKGRFYPIALGTVIGLNNGKVVEIGEDLIVVEEEIKGGAAKKTNRITRKLHRDQEEGAP